MVKRAITFAAGVAVGFVTGRLLYGVTNEKNNSTGNEHDSNQINEGSMIKSDDSKRENDTDGIRSSSLTGTNAHQYHSRGQVGAAKVQRTGFEGPEQERKFHDAHEEVGATQDVGDNDVQSGEEGQMSSKPIAEGANADAGTPMVNEHGQDTAASDTVVCATPLENNGCNLMSSTSSSQFITPIGNNRVDTMVVSEIYWYPIAGCKGVAVRGLHYDADNVMTAFDSSNNIELMMKMMLVDITSQTLDTMRYPVLRNVRHEVLDEGDVRLSVKQDGSDKSVEFKACLREVKFGKKIQKRLAVNINVNGMMKRGIDQGDEAALFFSQVMGVGGVRLMQLADGLNGSERMTVTNVANGTKVSAHIFVDGKVELFDGMEEEKLMNFECNGRVRVMKIVKKMVERDGDDENVVGVEVVGIDGNKRFVGIGDHVTVDQ